LRTIAGLLRFVNIFCGAILAGGQFLVLFGAVPVKKRLPPRAAVELHQEMLHTQVDRFLMPSQMISSVCAILLLAFRRQTSSAARPFYVLGLAGGVGVAVTSERFNKPTNRIILEWSLDKIPENYRQIADRWDRVHAIRTLCGVGSLACYIVAGLKARQAEQ
jgi:Domain of unknown function (DUF1772)